MIADIDQSLVRTSAGTAGLQIKRGNKCRGSPDRTGRYALYPKEPDAPLVSASWPQALLAVLDLLDLPSISSTLTSWRRTVPLTVTSRSPDCLLSATSSTTWAC